MIVFLFRYEILIGIGQFLVIENPLEQAQIIQALGWTGTERIDHAIKLYKRGWGNKLYFTGNGEALPFAFNNFGEVATAYADSQGVPEESVISSPSTASTYEEAVALKRLIYQNHDIQSVIIVSSPFHMRRVRMIFRKVLPDKIKTIFHPVPWSESKYARRWWSTEDSTAMVINEYIKLVYYYFKYMI